MNQSTSATRRYRANRENRMRENRARVMGQIGEGVRPRESTLKKYNILPAEVDAARIARDDSHTLINICGHAAK